MKIKLTLLFLNIPLIYYLLLPFPTYPNLPYSIQSQEVGDTTQISNVKAFYTNQYRKDVMPFFYKNISQPANALIHDRDQFLADSIAELDGNVVAVVGLAHLDGIVELWNKELNFDQLADDEAEL